VWVRIPALTRDSVLVYTPFVYSSCLFCNASLGHNEAIEAFPVGRRLAYDAAKGRLWVVCRSCDRWNLTPLEERWEAIEECEHAFRDTRLRVSTDQVGLARLREGLELVRIGAPQRPEMAAWRYGDQFGRRRRRAMLVGGGIVVASAGYVMAGPVLGLVATVGLGGTGVAHFLNLGRTVYRSRSVVARIPVEGGEALTVQRDQADHARLCWDRSVARWSLDIAHRVPLRITGPWYKLAPDRGSTSLSGEEAVGAARLLLPAINAAGAGRATVREAVDLLERAPTPETLFTRVAKSYTKREHYAGTHDQLFLRTLPTEVRLALEMSAHEEIERRAFEGELHLLESSWREAEEIAAIADDLLLPASVEEDLARLGRDRGAGPV
jgi:hypothetical protein